MYKFFECASSLNAYLQSERHDALNKLSEELSCDPESLAFIFESSDIDIEALVIPPQ